MEVRYGYPSTNFRKMMMLPDEATLLVKRNDDGQIENSAGWKFQSQKILLEDIDKIIKAKTMSKCGFMGNSFNAGHACHF